MSNQIIAARLLAAGSATASAADSRGRTPLHNACDGDTTPDASFQLPGQQQSRAGDATKSRGATPFPSAANSGSAASAVSVTVAPAATTTNAATASVGTAPAADDYPTRGPGSDSGRVNVARLLVNAGADPGARTTPAMPTPPVAAPSPASTGVCGVHRQGVAAATGVGGAGLAGKKRGELTGAQPNATAVAAMGGQVVGAGARAGAGVGASVEVGVGSGADGSDGGGGRRDGREAGMTPLHFACRSGSAELAEYLLRVGASVSALGAR